MGQRDFFKAFGVFLEKDLREVAINRSWCRNCPPDSRSYNMQLIARIDTYLSSLDLFMLLQVQADEAHARIHAAAEDGSDGSGSEAGYGSEAEYEEKCLRKRIIDVQLKMNNDFLQFILFFVRRPPRSTTAGPVRDIVCAHLVEQQAQVGCGVVRRACAGHARLDGVFYTLGGRRKREGGGG